MLRSRFPLPGDFQYVRTSQPLLPVHRVRDAGRWTLVVSSSGMFVSQYVHIYTPPTPQHERLRAIFWDFGEKALPGQRKRCEQPMIP